VHIKNYLFISGVYVAHFLTRKYQLIDFINFHSLRFVTQVRFAVFGATPEQAELRFLPQTYPQARQARAAA
jgi:hypothetical protein